jgi:hypothetical protein
MRELQKDNRFLAAVVQERKETQDGAYNERMEKQSRSERRKQKRRRRNRLGRSKRST